MNRLMTYEQWLELFKRQLRKYIKHKLTQVLYGVSMFMILTVPPLAMIIHWILRGGEAMDVLQVLFSLWTGNRCTAGLPEAIEKLTAEEQQEIRVYCENLERQAFDVGFKTAVQLWNQLDNTGGIME